MSRSYWLSAIALGLVLAGVAHAQPIGHHTSGNASTAQAQAKPKADTQPSDIAAVQNILQRIAGALEAANGKQQTTDEQQRAEQDLRDQNEMARWAKWMFWDGVVETILTVVGVLLIWRTLVHTRRGADAAADAVVETRRIGEAQVRAYVSIKDVSIEFLNDLIPEEAVPKIVINVKNTGQSPAYSFVWRPTLQYIGGGESRIRGFKSWIGAPGPSIAAGDPFEDAAMPPDMGITSFSKSTNPQIGIVLVAARIEYSYMDVFDKTITGIMYFSAPTGTIGGGFPNNYWRNVRLGLIPNDGGWGNQCGLHDQ